MKKEKILKCKKTKVKKTEKEASTELLGFLITKVAEMNCKIEFIIKDIEDISKKIEIKKTEELTN
jgi:hypothetical protein